MGALEHLLQEKPSSTTSATTPGSGSQTPSPKELSLWDKKYAPVMNSFEQRDKSFKFDENAGYNRLMINAINGKLDGAINDEKAPKEMRESLRSIKKLAFGVAAQLEKGVLDDKASGAINQMNNIYSSLYSKYNSKNVKNDNDYVIPSTNSLSNDPSYGKVRTKKQQEKYFDGIQVQDDLTQGGVQGATEVNSDGETVTKGAWKANYSNKVDLLNRIRTKGAPMLSDAFSKVVANNDMKGAYSLVKDVIQHVQQYGIDALVGKNKNDYSTATDIFEQIKTAKSWENKLSIIKNNSSKLQGVFESLTGNGAGSIIAKRKNIIKNFVDTKDMDAIDTDVYHLNQHYKMDVESRNVAAKKFQETPEGVEYGDALFEQTKNGVRVKSFNEFQRDLAGKDFGTDISAWQHAKNIIANPIDSWQSFVNPGSVMNSPTMKTYMENDYKVKKEKYNELIKKYKDEWDNLGKTNYKPFDSVFGKKQRIPYAEVSEEALNKNTNYKGKLTDKVIGSILGDDMNSLREGVKLQPRIITSTDENSGTVESKTQGTVKDFKAFLNKTKEVHIEFIPGTSTLGNGGRYNFVDINNPKNKYTVELSKKALNSAKDEMAKAARMRQAEAVLERDGYKYDLKEHNEHIQGARVTKDSRGNYFLNYQDIRKDKPDILPLGNVDKNLDELIKIAQNHINSL